MSKELIEEIAHWGRMVEAGNGATLTSMLASLLKFTGDVVNLIPKGDDLKQQLDGQTIEQLGTIQKDFSIFVDVAKANKSELQKLYDFIRLNYVPEYMDENAIQKVSIANIGTLHIGADAYCSVKPGKQEELKEWLFENGYEGAIKETVNSSTLKSLIKTRIKEGKEWPEDLVKFQPYSFSKVLKS